MSSNNNRNPVALIAIAFACLQSIAIAQGVADQWRAETDDGYSVGMSFENDVFVFQGNDRNYTVGIEVNYAGELADEAYLRLLDTPMRWLGDAFWPEHIRRRPGLALGLPAYTPRDLTVSELIETDRPYASLIYFEHRNLYVHPTRPEAIKTGALFGLMGTPVAETVQTEFHELIDGIEPRGWENEILRGTNPMLMYSLAHTRSVLPTNIDSLDPTRDPAAFDRVQLWGDLGGTLGYRTGLGARLNLAVGRITRPFHSHGSGGVGPAQFAPIGGDYSGTVPREDSPMFLKWLLPDEYFLSASASTAYVLNDASISGYYPLDDEYEIFEDRRESWRNAFTVGLTLRWDGFSGGFVYKSDSAELDFDDSRHEYGLVFLQFQGE